jgi:hypothetical protein
MKDKGESKCNGFAGFGGSHPCRKSGGKDGTPAFILIMQGWLLDAAFLQPGAVFLAGYSRVGGEPFAQVFDEFVDGAYVALFEAGVELGEAAQQALVFGAVGGEAGEVVQGEEAVFALNVQLHQIGDAGEHGTDGPVFGAMQESQAKFIQCVEQNAVLVVHSLYADGAGVIPGERSHWVPPGTANRYICLYKRNIGRKLRTC